MYFSQDSLDDNVVDPNPPQKAFDELEATMDLYNDEYDYFVKVPPSLLGQSDIYLSTALKKEDSKDNDIKNNTSQDKRLVTNIVQEPSQAQTNHAYDNPALDLQEQDLKTLNVNNLPSTEI